MANMDDGQMPLPEFAEEHPGMSGGFFDADQCHSAAGEIIVLQVDY
jgi:hypothetical protein